SRLSLADLSIQLRFPDHIFADETASLSVTVTNHKRIIPTFSLIVEPLSEPDIAEARSLSSDAPSSPGLAPLAASKGARVRGRTSNGQRHGANGPSATLSTTNDASVDRAPRNDGHRTRRWRASQTLEPLGKLAHFILIPPGTSSRQRIEHRFDRRGGYPIT